MHLSGDNCDRQAALMRYGSDAIWLINYGQENEADRKSVREKAGDKSLDGVTEYHFGSLHISVDTVEPRLCQCVTICHEMEPLGAAKSTPPIKVIQMVPFKP